MPDIASLKLVTFRSLVMFFLTLVAVRAMGKRSIAQLAPFDLTVIIIIGSAAMPLEGNIGLWNGFAKLIFLFNIY